MNIDMSISTSPLQVSFNGPVIVSKDYVLKARIQGVDNNLINKNLEIHNRTWNTDFKMLNLISNCSFDNEIISVTFKNEAELYETDISFEGVLYSDYSEYEYSRLSHKGTGIYYTAVNPQEKAQVKDDTQSVTKYSYDNMGNVTSVTNGLPNETSPLTLGQTTAYEYDVLGRMTKETTPEGKVQTYAYDLGGRLLSSTDKKNIQTQYTYDALDNILSVVKGNQSISYTYDLKGNRTSMTDSTGTTSYTYSPYGELTSERKGDILNSYTYDALGRRLSMSITDDGAPVTSQTYNYDSMSRLVNTQNGTDTAEYTYDANSNVLTEKVNGTLLKETTYNAGNLPEFITTYLPDTTETSHRTYSANGNLRMEFRNDRDIFYYYDGANRLILENCLGDEISYEDYYTYDRLGNRTKKEHRDVYTDETQNTSYTYNNLNQLISQTYRTETLTYSYDDNGNMLSAVKDGTPIKTYTYDVFNRLDTANTNGNTTSYTYNGDNLRQTKTVNGVTTKHIYDGQNIVADVSQNTNVYVYGIDILGMRANNSNLKTFATTPRGDVSSLISPDGTYDEYEYDAYGNPIADNDHSVNPFGYTGQYTDYETGLIYLRNRYYDTELGIFITEDPAKDGLNWYAYCGGNPVVFVDLWGLYYTETDSDGRVYAVIESGDTLSGISKAEVNDVSAYTKMNYVGNPDKIYPGQKVEITGIYNDKYPNPYSQSNNMAVMDFNNYDYSNDTVTDEGWMITATAVGSSIVSKLGITVAGKIFTTLAPTAPTAFDYANKAVQQIDNFSVSLKHLANAGGNYSKFATTDPSVVNIWVSNALTNAKSFVVNSSDSYYTIVNMGNVIGTKGETFIKVVFTTAGKIITAYPFK